MVGRAHAPAATTWRARSIQAMMVGATIAMMAPVPTSAQERPDDELSLPIVQQVLESLGDDAAALLDELEEYRRHPIVLADASPEELARLPGISPALAEAILAYARYNHPASFQDLRSIQGLDRERIAILRAYTSIEPPADQRAVTTSVRTRWLRDAEPRRGFSEMLERRMPRLGPAGDSTGVDTVSVGPAYLGSRDGILLRIDAETPSLAVAATIEKDPGERLLGADTAGILGRSLEYVDPRRLGPVTRSFDAFASAALRGIAGPVTFYLGDYSAEFGEGLVFGGSSGGFKGGDIIRGAVKSPRGLRLYRSTTETGFLRGAAAEAALPLRGIGTLRGTLFASWRALDATIEGEGDAATVRTFRDDGLHRTRSEIDAAGSVGERIAGGRVQVESGRFRIGATGYLLRYSLPVQAELPFEFTGDRAGMAGIDAAWGNDRMRVAAEVAAGHGGVGALGGITWRARSFDLALALRALPPGFYSPYGFGFGESPRAPANEQGLYGAVGLRLLPDWHLAAYCDLYRFPERTRTVPLPRSGVDSYLELSWSAARNLTVAGRLRNERQDRMATAIDSLGREVRPLALEERTSIRMEIDYASTGDFVRLRGRIERKFISIPELGRAFGGTSTSLDLRFRPARSVLTGIGITLFDVDQSDAAVTVAEQDLPGRLVSTTLSGRGRRCSWYLRWRPAKRLSLTIRYGETLYSDRTAISAGDSQEIDGATAGNLAAQLDLSF